MNYTGRGYWCAAAISSAAADCQKTKERSKAPSRFNRPRRRVRRGRGDFCGGKSHFPEQKSLPCSFRARKSVGFQRKLVGVAVAGEFAPPSTQRVKRAFLTRCGSGFFRRLANEPPRAGGIIFAHAALPIGEHAARALRDGCQAAVYPQARSAILVFQAVAMAAGCGFQSCARRFAARKPCPRGCRFPRISRRGGAR